MKDSEKKTGLRRLHSAFFYSVNGFIACFKSEEAFRIEVILSLFLVPAAFFIGETAIEQSVLIGVLVLVLITELFNSAMERAIDRISLDRHDLSKEAKDIASTAVFVAIIFAIFVWALISIPKFL